MVVPPDDVAQTLARHGEAEEGEQPEHVSAGHTAPGWGDWVSGGM